jgi:NADPH:quinone reductase-like Zn-dependent oxidoreductase
MAADDHDRRGGSIVMRRYGGPDVLQFETVPLTALLPDEIRLRSIASAINHSDLEIRAGNWPIRRREPFPYTPGLEVVGEVVEVGSGVSEQGLLRRLRRTPTRLPWRHWDSPA